MPNELLSWLVPLACTAIVGVTAWVIKLEVEKALMKSEIKGLQDRLKEFNEKNTEQHRELYESRNSADKVLERVVQSIETMSERQQSIDQKFDRLFDHLLRGAEA